MNANDIYPNKERKYLDKISKFIIFKLKKDKIICIKKLKI